jgi:4-hydroxy-2-oxoheptanedioate aldolase
MMQGLDVGFIGPMDLSVDFGVPGQFDHPEVVTRIHQIEEAAARCGTHMGAFVGSVEQAAKLATAGYRYLAVSGDVTMLGNSAKTLVSSLHQTANKFRSAKQ